MIFLELRKIRWPYPTCGFLLEAIYAAWGQGPVPAGLKIDLSCEVHHWLSTDQNYLEVMQIVVYNAQWYIPWVTIIHFNIQSYSELLFISLIHWYLLVITFHEDKSEYGVIPWLSLQNDFSQCISFIARKLLRYLVLASKHWDNYLARHRSPVSIV